MDTESEPNHVNVPAERLDVRRIRRLGEWHEVRQANTFGVLKLTLHAKSYDWEFVPEAGKTFTDSGTGTCH